MAQISVAVRNAKLDAIETTIGASPILRIRSGAAPANCAAADTGTVLATINLAADWASAAANGSKAFVVPVQDATADATGTAAHFRIYSSGGTCHMQGTVGTSGADLNLASVTLTAGQGPITINSFTMTEGNA